ncbi:MAG: hypothetical protein H6623_05180 [Bdellovibrionaceae bacterium]|nr:hypothetical protein [Pseudobdellovibrionaceae bacterium]
MSNFVYITIALVFGLSGCVTATPYKAATSDSGAGYRDKKIDEDKYRVVFRGNEETSRETVEIYLLYRAAEVTLENGDNYFLVIEQKTDTHTSYYSTSPVFYGAYGRGSYRYPYYAYGYSWVNAPGMQTLDRYEAIAYITLYKEKPPGNNAELFNAKEVLKNLAPDIHRPQK